MGEIAVKVIINAEVERGGQIHYDPELSWGLFGDDRQPTGYDIGAFVGGQRTHHVARTNLCPDELCYGFLVGESGRRITLSRVADWVGM